MRRPLRSTAHALAAASFQAFDAHTARESPGMARPVDARVLRARRDPERVELSVVIIRRAAGAVDGAVQLVRALHEIQAVDDEADRRFTAQASPRPAV